MVPLIDARNLFSAMECAIASARRSVYLAGWVFNPMTPLLVTRRGGRAAWLHLLREAAARGVEVRIIICDLDPIFMRPHHRDAWWAHELLTTERMRLPLLHRDRLQFICSRHPATTRLVPPTNVDEQLEQTAKDLNSKITRAEKGKKVKPPRVYRWLPGLWPWIVFDEKKQRFQIKDHTALAIRTSSHHQKFCVIDRARVFCSGMDVRPGLLDDTTHNGSREDPRGGWHDLGCAIEGTVAEDIARSFEGRWNIERVEYTRFVQSCNSLEQRLAALELCVTHPLDPAGSVLPDGTRDDEALTLCARRLGTQRPPPPVSTVQLLRTVSRRGLPPLLDPTALADWTTTGTETIREDIAEAYQRAISLATEYIYIENQYIRAKRLADWIINRLAHKDAKNLRVILVVPNLPEEVGPTGKADAITINGLHNQFEIIEDLRRAMGGRRFGCYSIVRNKPVGGSARPSDIKGRPQIYLHSKCMIVDDIYATIGSANLDERGFRLASEMNVAWVEPEGVRQLRLKLWHEHLGAPPALAEWKPADFVDKWNEIANYNLQKIAKKERLKGHAVPHAAERPSQPKLPIIPPIMVHTAPEAWAADDEDVA